MTNAFVAMNSPTSNGSWRSSSGRPRNWTTRRVARRTWPTAGSGGAPRGGGLAAGHGGAGHVPNWLAGKGRREPGPRSLVPAGGDQGRTRRATELGRGRPFVVWRLGTTYQGINPAAGHRISASTPHSRLIACQFAELLNNTRFLALTVWCRCGPLIPELNPKAGTTRFAAQGNMPTRKRSDPAFAFSFSTSSICQANHGRHQAQAWGPSATPSAWILVAIIRQAPFFALFRLLLSNKLAHLDA